MMALILSTSRITPATCVYTALHGCYGFRASSTSPVTTVISASSAPPSPLVSTLSFNCDSQHHSLKLVNFRLLWVVKEEMYREVSVNGLNIQRREKFKTFFYQNDHYHYSQVTLEGCIIIIYTIPTTIVTSPPGKLGALLALQYLSSLDSTLLFGPRQFSWWALYALVQKERNFKSRPNQTSNLHISVLSQKFGSAGTTYPPTIMQGINQILLQSINPALAQRSNQLLT